VNRLVVVSGIDPSGHAGMLRDIAASFLIGITPIVVPSALTYQNETGVEGVSYRHTQEIVRAVKVALGDKQAIFKVGLVSPDTVVALKKAFPHSTIVWNIVLASSSGYAFFTPEDIKAALPYADYILLNSEEARVLGLSPSGHIIITGGHGDGDIVIKSDKDFVFSRVKGDFRGTGCTFSTLFSGFLTYGYGVHSAIVEAGKLMIKVLEASKMGFASSEALLGRWHDEYMKRQIGDATHMLAPFIYSLMPEVGINMAYMPYMPYGGEKPEDAFIFPGRIRLKGNEPVYLPPAKGYSSHTARMVAFVRARFPHIRCVMNIRFDEDFVERARSKDLFVFEVYRESEPEDSRKKEGHSLQWMLKPVLELDNMPDVVFDRGGHGKEPMIRVFGTDPIDVAYKVIKIVGG